MTLINITINLGEKYIVASNLFQLVNNDTNIKTAHRYKYDILCAK